jgi:transposase
MDLTPFRLSANQPTFGTPTSYCTQGITNSVAEGMNSKIMFIKRRVGGYRNPDNFKTAIFFHCGGLELYPQ